MRTTVRKWGNSLAIRLPHAVASELALQESLELDLTARNGTLVASPVGRWTLEALVAPLREGAAAAPVVPDRGDVVWVDTEPALDPAGRRPALVVSPEVYNLHGLALVCPITSVSKGYPFEVNIPPGHRTEGVVLADQLRTVDWRARRAERTERIPDLVREVLAKARTLLD